MKTIIKISNPTNWQNEIISFFKNYEFKIGESNSNQLVFFKNESVFNTSKMNPLDVDSKITLKFEENQIVADFNFFNQESLNKSESQNVYKTFVKTFTTFITDKIKDSKQLEFQANNNQIIYLYYLISLLLGGIFAIILLILISDHTEISSLFYGLIIVSSLMVCLRIAQRLSKKFNLTSSSESLSSIS